MNDQNIYVFTKGHVAWSPDCSLRMRAQQHGQDWLQPEMLAFRLEDLALIRDTGCGSVSARPKCLQVSVE